MTGNLLGSFLERDLDSIGLFQTLFDQFVWHAIGTQQRLSSILVELGRILCLEEIGHRRNPYFLFSCKTCFLIAYLLLVHAGNQSQQTTMICQQKVIIIVNYTLVGEQIRGWYSVLKARC
jgi:hypothetical protein